MKKIIFLLSILISISNIQSQESTIKKIPIASGPEDFVLDQGNLLISCAERRKEAKYTSGIWKLNLENEKTTEFELELLEERKFSPHGISLLKEDKSKYLFVVNHYAKNESEIICFKIEENILKEIKSFRDKTIKKPNSVVAVSLEHFYFTNSILFSGSVGEYKQGNYQLIVKNISYANGIIIYQKELYVAATMGNKLLKLVLDNNKYIKEKIVKLKGPDNIRIFKDKLLIAGHTNISKFIAHAKNKNKISPFIIYEFDTNTQKVKVLFEDNGAVMSGAASAVVYNSFLYISQVFEGFVLRVKLD